MIYLHIDVDNLWMYEKEFGITIHQNKELIYTNALPLLLKLLKKTNSKATFMIIGQDLSLVECQNFCKRASKQGHEIANHTWSHPITFNALSRKEKEKEILKTHKKIIELCGKAPVGFRGPGYFIDREIISILKNLNYTYDSSVLPGIGPLLMSMYVNMKGGRNKNKKFSNPNIKTKNNPYYITGLYPDDTLLELPISTLPILSLPIHSTFAFSFGSIYRTILIKYLNSKPGYLLYLLHAVDLVDLQKEKADYPVITLRHSFHDRLAFIEEVIETLVRINGGPLKTSRDTI